VAKSDSPILMGLCLRGILGSDMLTRYAEFLRPK
jgi:hypothetical protein